MTIDKHKNTSEDFGQMLKQSGPAIAFTRDTHQALYVHTSVFHQICPSIRDSDQFFAVLSYVR
jgi:hypothetical protein